MIHSNGQIMIKDRKNLEELTMMRAIAILLIIECHLTIFLKLGIFQEPLYQSSFYTAPIGLTMFFFVSGFLLYYHYNSIQSIKNALTFYYKRFKRIYPLYWLALLLCVSLTIFTHGILTLYPPTWTSATIVANFLGIQEFLYNEGLQTHFWFISVITMYYLLYPIIIRPKNLVNALSIAIIIFLSAYAINSTFNLIEIHFFRYYWTFILGIIICWIKYNKSSLFSKNYRDYFILILLTPMLALVPRAYYEPYYLVISIISCLILYYCLNVLFENKALNIKITSTKLYELLLKISIASFAVYLFHPIVLYFARAILTYYNVENVFYYNLMVVLIIIPLIFVFGYYLQLLEFKIIKMDVSYLKIKSKLESIISRTD